MKYWQPIDPEKFDPRLFNLPSIQACKIRENAKLGDIEELHNNGWSFFADLQNKCPLSGIQLSEPTWYLFAAK